MIVARETGEVPEPGRYFRCASDGLQTVVDAQVPLKSHIARSSTIMNLLTDVLAGIIHFIGWLV
ncbi:hypothetical protein AQI88_17255 [Streptomyces cellostaticus]|uniref:Uncharacterized protein n=1 Tax=Streptomyces cellostaticus TaxID=67285 RepID=A0A117PW66_9ACTN|nr:hypothetical protein AQI88_17255 [Streptomyces cellostaticus]GHI01918.1 hypothetical protein Scel_02390 [Streptomyces cellostaticus]